VVVVVIVGVVVGVLALPVVCLPVGAFFDVSLLLLLFAFSSQSGHEIVFDLLFDLRYSGFFESLFEVRFDEIGNFQLLRRSRLRILVARFEAVG